MESLLNEDIKVASKIKNNKTFVTEEIMILQITKDIMIPKFTKIIPVYSS